VVDEAAAVVAAGVGDAVGAVDGEAPNPNVPKEEEVEAAVDADVGADDVGVDAGLPKPKEVEPNVVLPAPPKGVDEDAAVVVGVVAGADVDEVAAVVVVDDTDDDDDVGALLKLNDGVDEVVVGLPAPRPKIDPPEEVVVPNGLGEDDAVAPNPKEDVKLVVEADGVASDVVAGVVVVAADGAVVIAEEEEDEDDAVEDVDDEEEEAPKLGKADLLLKIEDEEPKALVEPNADEDAVELPNMEDEEDPNVLGASDEELPENSNELPDVVALGVVAVVSALLVDVNEN